MTYVDPLFTFGGSGAPPCFRNRPSCHLYADTLPELHEMATRIGLRLSWFQNDPSLPHYDLTPSRRALAVRAGAIEQTRREAVETWKRLREARISQRSSIRVTPSLRLE